MRALASVAWLTLTRMTRSATLWIAALAAVLPIGFAALVRNQPRALHFTFEIDLLLLAVLTPLFVAAAIGEEFEDGTATYLWSRSLPRWTVLIGKLLALAPIVALFMIVSWTVAATIIEHHLPAVRSAVAIGVGALAIATIVAGLAISVPGHAMALAIAYVAIDYVVGQIPAAIQLFSVTRQANLLGSANEPWLTPAIAIAVIATGWLIIGVRRINRLEL
jgi:ABC-type transport system involved in multi-copper enzyme maturation permease subunit